MIDITRKSDIDKLSNKEQLAFYKGQFEFQHCEYNDCGHEVYENWALYNGELYFDECFEQSTQKDREDAKKEVERLERELSRAKETLNEYK
ncbi:hypothetical protein [Rossellomorea marisflavi]|uniref:hypothetical protein n=1 Tax=Rossellomorea marisflavi TaxID=189381 RepID=UPI003FA0DBB5